MRNEQIYNLRQRELLTKEAQEAYFAGVVDKLFTQEQPSQILFSFLQDDMCIGYGGLVHIDWMNKNAEISFILNSENNNQENYLKLFNIYLKLIEELAKTMALHKIYTYGYATGEYRFIPLIENSFDEEAVLAKHIAINGKLHDIKIYSKLL